MDIFEIILIGVGLSMDAFAVTISNMFVYRNLSRTRMMLMPITFGFFQGIMPLIGCFAGTFFADMMSRYAGIISFLILGFIGGKMIWDALHEEPETNTLEKPNALKRLPFPPFFYKVLLLLLMPFLLGYRLLHLQLNLSAAARLSLSLHFCAFALPSC